MPDGSGFTQATHSSGKKYPDSVDFSTVENVVYRQEERRKMRQGEGHIELSLRFLVALSIGLVVGALAFSVRVATDKLYEYKFESIKDFTVAGDIPDSPIEPPVPQANPRIWAGFMFYILWNTGLVMLGCSLVVYVAPAAGGSGIPDVKGYLNGSLVSKAFNIVTLAVKWISVILSVASSLAVGPEGPMIHLGAMVGAGFGEMRSRTFGLKIDFFKHYRNTVDRRDFISVGAASGVSAAFGAPIGGLLFSMEEASSFWSVGLTWKAFLGALAANGMLNFLVAVTETKKVKFLPDNDLLFPHGQSSGFYLWEYIPFCGLGIVGGVLGFIFTYLNVKLMSFRLRKVFVKKRYRILEVLFIVIITSAASFTVPLMWPCKFTPLEEIKGFHLDNAERFTCRYGHYNEMASLLWASQDNAVKRLLSRDTASLFSPVTCLTFCLLYFTLACYTAGCSISSGLVVPMLLIGCAYGRFTSLILNQTFGFSLDPGTYALIGAASFIGGVSRMTMSMTVILIEITGDTELVLPIMAVILIAKTIADRISHPLYESLLELRHIPYLETDPTPEMRIMPVTCIMSSPVVTMNAMEPIKEILKILTSSCHNGFPVLHNKTGTLIGMISRKYLLVMLYAYAEDNKLALRHTDFLRYIDTIHMERITIRNVAKMLRFANHDQVLFLSKYMDLCPTIVSTTSTVAGVLRLVRTMGLRHLPVVNHFNVPVGMVTRKDLLEDNVIECYRTNLYEIHHTDPAYSVSHAEWPPYIRKLEALHAERTQNYDEQDANLFDEFLTQTQDMHITEGFEQHVNNMLLHPKGFKHYLHSPLTNPGHEHTTLMDIIRNASGHVKRSFSDDSLDDGAGKPVWSDDEDAMSPHTPLTNQQHNTSIL